VFGAAIPFFYTPEGADVIYTAASGADLAGLLDNLGTVAQALGGAGNYQEAGISSALTIFGEFVDLATPVGPVLNFATGFANAITPYPQNLSCPN
jgi:hypothetical protein